MEFCAIEHILKYMLFILSYCNNVFTNDGRRCLVTITVRYVIIYVVRDQLGSAVVNGKKSVGVTITGS